MVLQHEGVNWHRCGYRTGAHRGRHSCERPRCDPGASTEAMERNCGLCQRWLLRGGTPTRGTPATTVISERYIAAGSTSLACCPKPQRASEIGHAFRGWGDTGTQRVLAGEYPCERRVPFLG